MQFRLVRCSLKVFAKHLPGALLLAALGISSFAHATLTIQTANRGSLSTADNNVWYVGTDTSNPLAAGSTFDNDGTGYVYTSADLNSSQVSEAGALSNILEFNILSTLNVTGLQAGQSLALVVTMTNSLGSSAVYPVAIASVNGAACGSTSACQIAGVNYVDPAGGSNSTWYYAIPYVTAQSVRIGIYPRDICTSYLKQSNGTDAAGCGADSSNGTYRTAQIGSTTSIVLTFQLQVLTNNNLTLPLPAAKESASVNLRFENSSGRTALTCPSVTYFPGDTQIFADTSGFSQGPPAGFAPLNAAIVVGRKNSAAPVLPASGNFLTGNDLLARVGMNTNQPVGGFTNLTSASDSVNTYQIAFLARDSAGLVYTPAGTGCPITGVQTSEIQGFLAKSSCFIATAAFRSIDAPPVAMLREFRDRILLPTEAGKAFVRWYYRWSPSAAEWLMMHSEFRYPVLQALIPVEILAWLMTHPVHLTGLIVLTLSTVVLSLGYYALVRARRRVSR